MNKKYNDLIGDIIKKDNYEYEKELKGKGEPLSKNYQARDILQNFQKVARDAGFLPPWLKLQKEIAALVHRAKTKKDVKLINNKIRKYNKICPAPMQRSPIQLENLTKAKSKW